MRRHWLIFGLLVACGHTAAWAQEAPRYTLTEDMAQTGTAIKHKGVKAAIPLNYSYAQLSEEQKLAVRDQYEGMPATDEPPYPLKGLAPFLREVYAAQRILQVRGKLVLAVQVNSKGEGKEVSIFESPDDKMANFAAAAAIKQRYKPGVCGGVPCTMDFVYTVTFNLPSDEAGGENAAQ
ncbi:hypothetical protein MRBLMS1_002776 [Massilia sp. LMS1-1-1.1]